jgi:hypothetical protein
LSSLSISDIFPKKLIREKQFENAPISIGEKKVGDVLIMEGVFSNTPALSGMKHKGTYISWEVPYVVVLQRDEMYGVVTCGACHPRTGQLYPDNVLILAPFITDQEDRA